MLFWEVCGLPGARPGLLQRDKEVQPPLRYLVIHLLGPSDTAR